MGRPPITPTDVVTVRHIDTGHAVAWCNGEFSGDKELTDAARTIQEAGEPVDLGPMDFPVTDDAPGAAAAMLAACCGRGQVVDRPSILVDGE